MKNVTSSKHLYATLKPYLLSLFLHLIVTLVVAQDDDGIVAVAQNDDWSSVYPPPDLITVACGYTGPQLNLLDHRSWIGDVYSKYSPLEEHQSGQASVVREAPPSSSVTRMPYTWARLSRSAFTYRFSLATDGQKFIRLHFNPVSYGPDLDRSKALFSVAAGGYTFLHNFNASVTADAYGVETLCREFCLNVDGKKLLNITFTPSQSSLDAYAFINGIEIVSMPTNLYYTAPDGVISYVGNGGGKEFRVGNSTALETVYRMNVGGIPLSTQNDSGMYRNWDGLEKEQNYLEASSLLFSRIEHANITLDLSKIASYAAPTQVYQTGRSIMSADSTLIYNLSWEFPVDSEFSYLVRMHFCWLPPVDHFRSFEIYIAGHKAEEQANILAWGGGAGIPLYRDYVASMDSSGSSQKKTNLSIAMYGPSNSAILNGLEIFKLNNSRGNLAGLGPNPDPRHHVPRPKLTHMHVIVAGAVSGIVVLISALVGAFLIFRRNWRKAKSSSANSLPPYSCRYFSLAEIKAATQNFNSCFIIGVGGFGNVYKGCIDGGATPVAIKRLKPESSQGAHEFKTEIEMLSQLRHRHLVSLIGYSSDKGEMILVYDYMARGTLADHLYHHKDNLPPPPLLSWEQRLHICIGAARGLQYLHSGAKGTIIHRDVKSTNILLDEKWVAKVSDFGLSKMGTADTSKTHISTVVKGSFGYLDPEYYRLQRLTEKSDVYSFGIVLCEVLCGRPAVIHTDTVEQGQINLAQWAKRCYRDGKLDQIIDPSIDRGGKMIETEGLNKFVEISMSCMHDNGIERPSMDDVVRGLEFALQLHRNCVESNTSSSEQSCVTDGSIKCISATIFSEIRDPSGR